MGSVGAPILYPGYLVDFAAPRLRGIEKTVTDEKPQDRATPEELREIYRNAALLFAMVERLEGLGWRTVTVSRLSRVARGDASAIPPLPPGGR